MVEQIYHLESGVDHKTSSHTTLEQLKKPRKYQNRVAVFIQYVCVHARACSSNIFHNFFYNLLRWEIVSGEQSLSNRPLLTSLLFPTTHNLPLQQVVK